MQISFKSASAKNYLFTFLVEMLIAISSLIMIRFASNILVDGEFSEFMVSRRVMSSLQPFVILGLGVAIPRFVAMVTAQNRLDKASDYFFASLGIVFISGLFFSLLSLIFKSAFANLFFGDPKFDYLVFPLCLLILGALLHVCVYGYYRGTMRMGMANSIQFINLGLVPVSVFYFFNTSQNILYSTALVWIAVSFVFLILIIAQIKFSRMNIFQSAKELLTYSIPRVPGDFLLGFYFALPVIIINHTENLAMGGLITVGITFLNMFGAIFTPICLMLLTDASQMIVKGEMDKLRRQTILILKVTLFLTLTGVLILEIFTPFLIENLLNIHNEVANQSTRIIALSAIGYTLFISLRSILDAYYIRPMNTINIIICFTLFSLSALSCYQSNLGYESILYCFSSTLIVLGILTLYETNKIILIKKHKC